MSLRRFYLIMCALGTVVPWIFFANFFAKNGLDIPLFVMGLFSNGCRRWIFDGCPDFNFGVLGLVADRFSTARSSQLVAHPSSWSFCWPATRFAALPLFPAGPTIEHEGLICPSSSPRQAENAVVPALITQ